jgi:hypothetical protein
VKALLFADPVFIVFGKLKGAQRPPSAASVTHPTQLRHIFSNNIFFLHTDALSIFFLATFLLECEHGILITPNRWIGIVTRLIAGRTGLDSRQRHGFLFLRYRVYWLWDLPSLLIQRVPWTLSLFPHRKGVKWPRRETDRSLSSRVTPPYLHGLVQLYLLPFPYRIW